MKRHFLHLALLPCVLAGPVAATPIAVPNFSFEAPALGTTGTTLTNNITPWAGTNGTSNANAFIEYAAPTLHADTPGVGNNRQYLGLVLGYDCWSQLPETYQPNTRYTLNVAVGNRSGQTVAGNDSRYGFATGTGTVLGTGSANAMTLAAAQNFAEAPPFIFDTTEDVAGTGQTIRVLVQARGNGRSHFDNIRLDAAPSPQNGRPLGTLSAATGVTAATATLNGTVTDAGSAAPAVTFYYGPQDGLGNVVSWAFNGALPGTHTGAFSLPLTGLVPATRYYYRARLENASGFTWASPSQFFDTPATAPTVLAVPAGSITATSAVVGANITDTGGLNPAVTVYWGTVDGGTNPVAWPNNVSLGAAGLGVKSTTLSGLAPGTQYFFRPSANNTGGTAWAPSTFHFTTQSVLPPAVVNRPATNIDFTSAELNCEVTATGNAATTAVIYYGTTDGGTNAGSWTSSLNPGVSAGQTGGVAGGLAQGTNYFFRAFVSNSAGAAWAPASSSFTTDSAELPSVATRPATNITATMADLRGEVTDTGNDVPVVKFYWGTTDGGNIAGNWTSNATVGPDSGDFERILTGLTPATTFYFRASATNSAGTAWAATSESFTTLTAGPVSHIVINEINYDPVSAALLTEYVELHNPGGAAVDLAGWKLRGEVDFDFGATTIPSGGYLCVVQNVAAFDTQYSNVTFYPGRANRVGPWTGVLKNSGGDLRLLDAAGNVVDETDYNSAFPWPTAAKGGGPTAELIHPSLDNTLGASWRSALTTFIAPGSTWRWRRGVVGDTGETATPFTAWRTLGFVEPAAPAANAEWADAPLPLGYGNVDGIAAIGGVETEHATLLPDMQTGGTAPDYTSVYLRKVFNIPAGQVPPQLRLRLKADDGAIVWINNVEVAVARTRAAGGHQNHTALANAQSTAPPLFWEIPVTINAATVSLAAGDNIIAIHALNQAGASLDFHFDAELAGVGLGTPGAPNRSLLAGPSNAPPAIRDVDHEPQEPASGVPVLITAVVTDPDNVTAVSLAWQTVDPGGYIRKSDVAYENPANWTSLPMLDNGTGGDVTAGDSIYSATIPGSVQTHRRLVRYRINITDGSSNTVRVPYPDDEQPNFAYFCYNGVPAWTGALRPTSIAGFPITADQTYSPALLKSLPPWHLIASNIDIVNSQYNNAGSPAPVYNDRHLPCTLVYDGVVYDHIEFKNRGIGSTYVSGKNKWALYFNRGRNLHVRDNWGRKYDQTWNSMSLDANASPWASVHRGSAGVEEAVSYRIFELGGVPSLRTTYVHWRVIDNAVEAANPASTVSDPTFGSGDGQFSGDLWGLYLAMEPMESNFIDERGIPDGNLYSIEGSQGDKKNQAVGQPTDSSDWNAFRNANNQAGQNETWYRTNADLPALFTFLGLSRLIGNVDVRPGDNYRYYHRSSDNRWLPMAYDLDMQFIPAHHWGGTIDGTVMAGLPTTVLPITRHPAIALEYRNRCRELLSLMASDASPNGGQIGQLIDEYAAMVNPPGVELTWSDLDAAMWNVHPRTAGGGAASGQSSHKANYWRANYNDGTRGGLGGTTQTGTWVRQLPDPDANSFSDHEGMMQWFVNFSTNTYPVAATPWVRKATGASGGGTDTDVNRQKGFGYKYLEWESLFGGFANANVNPAPATADTAYPYKPTINYTGTPGYPANDLRFRSGDFDDPQGAASIAAVQWRIGEISAPGIPGYDPSEPRRYELEEVWTSAEIATASPTGIPDVRVPASAVRTGHTYRARVRHKDNTGRWSYWSEPLPFIVATADTTAFASVLRVSEINYNPAVPTAAEMANPGWNPAWNAQDMEFIEVSNISSTAVDLTDVRFTKGVDYDFPFGFSLPGNTSVAIAKNRAAFQIRYGAAVNLAPGEYGTGNLANGGEEVKLSYGTGTAIIEFTYSDTAPWPVSPDGTGPTLVLRTPAKQNLDHNDPLEWRASSSVNGSPGATDLWNYTSWAATYPGAGAPGSNPDGDTFDNRLEYGLLGDPFASSTAQSPVGGFAGGYATLTFTRRGGTSDLTFDVQFSTGLMTWNIPGVFQSATLNANGSVTEVWRSADPVSARPRLFGRVRVTQTP